MRWTMLRTLFMAAFVLVGGVVAARYVDQSAHTPAAAAMAVASPAVQDNSGSMVIKAGAATDFRVEASVDGRRLDFVVDNGASQITLS